MFAVLSPVRKVKFCGCANDRWIWLVGSLAVQGEFDGNVIAAYSIQDVDVGAMDQVGGEDNYVRSGLGNWTRWFREVLKDAVGAVSDKVTKSISLSV